MRKKHQPKNTEGGIMKNKDKQTGQSTGLSADSIGSSQAISRHEQQEILKLFVEHVPAVVAMLDRDMKYLACSSRWLSDYGIEQQDIIGRSHYEIFPKIDDRWKDIYNRCLQGASEKSDEDFFVRNDGQKEWLRWEIHPWRTATGQIGGIIIFAEIITERKKTEQALRDSEIQYRRLFESAKDGILILDAETGVIDDVNPFLTGMLGYSKELFIGKKVWEIGFFRDLIANKDNFLELQRKNYIRYEDLPLETADGQQIDVEFVSNVYLVEGKKVIQCNIRNITERKRIENSLREKQADLNRAQTVGQLGSWRMDVRRNVLVWSAENHRIFGIPEGTVMTYETFLKTLHPDDLQYVDKKWKDALKGEPYDVEHRIIVGGNIKWVRERAELEFDDKGAVLGGFGTTQDVTERKKREEELYKLNRALTALSHSNQAMMRATDETEYMNEVCRIIVEDCGYKMVWIGFAKNNDGKTVCPVASAGFDEVYFENTSADTEDAQGPSEKVIFAGEMCFCKDMLADPEFKHWRKQALRRGYTSSVVLPLMDRNRAFGVINIYSKEPDSFSDAEMNLISELVGDLAHGIMELRLRNLHTQIEAALGKSEKRYRALFDSMTEGFALHEIICNKEGIPCDYRFLEINQAFEKLTGLKRKDVLYKTHNEILPDDDPKWLECYGKVALTGEPIEFENYSAPLKRHYQVFAYCPAPRQFAVIFMDISERKQAEAILNRDKETLKRIVKEGSEKLLEVQVELERAKRLSDIGTLASTVAHELRNPLAAIIISAAIIRRRSNDEAIEKQLRNIDKMVDESDQIINNLLFYSRLRSPHHKNIAIYDIIDECVKNQSRQIKKKMQFKRNFNLLKDVMMNADPVQMKEVFHNLLHNAADAVSDDCGEVEILGSDHHEFIKIHIKDNGHGIDARDKEKVFDPFFTTKAKGTGLGLTVCNQIVSMHGGSIDIESETGKGTIVTIVLPKRDRFR